jgi:hypothetical protein
MASPDPKPRAALPWLDRNDYPALLKIVPRLPPRWQEWRNQAGGVRRFLSGNGVSVVETPVNLAELRIFLRRQQRERLLPEELVAFCQRRLEGTPDPEPVPEAIAEAWRMDLEAEPRSPPLPPGRKPTQRLPATRARLAPARPAPTKKTPPPRS